MPVQSASVRREVWGRKAPATICRALNAPQPRSRPRPQPQLQTTNPIHHRSHDNEPRPMTVTYQLFAPPTAPSAIISEAETRIHSKTDASSMHNRHQKGGSVPALIIFPGACKKVVERCSKAPSDFWAPCPRLSERRCNAIMMSKTCESCLGSRAHGSGFGGHVLWHPLPRSIPHHICSQPPSHVPMPIMCVPHVRPLTRHMRHLGGGET